MEIVTRALPPDHEIILFGDTHEGSILKHKKGVRELVNYIKEKKNCFAVHMGDLVESIAIDDLRYDRLTTDPGSPVSLNQYMKAAEELAPIKDKLLVIMQGNHDWKTISKHGDFVKDLVCRDLGVPYGTYECWLEVQKTKHKLTARGKDAYKIFLAHGAGTLSSNAKDPIQRRGNQEAALKQRLYPEAGDCVIMAMGHTHKLMVVRPTQELYMHTAGGKVKQSYRTTAKSTTEIDKDHRWYLNTGSFLRKYGPRGVSGYAERFMLRPAELGYVKVMVEDYEVQDCVEVRV